MKKTLLLALLFATAVVATSQARIRIPVGQYQKIEPVLELPEEDWYRTEDGRKVDLGHMYTVYQIAYVPVWTIEKGKLVGYTKEDPDTYYDLDESMLERISGDTGIENFDELRTMPFWDAWGGKLVALAVIAAIVYYFCSKNDDDESEAVPEAEKPAE